VELDFRGLVLVVDEDGVVVDVDVVLDVRVVVVVAVGLEVDVVVLAVVVVVLVVVVLVVVVVVLVLVVEVVVVVLVGPPRPAGSCSQADGVLLPKGCTRQLVTTRVRHPSAVSFWLSRVIVPLPVPELKLLDATTATWPAGELGLSNDITSPASGPRPRVPLVTVSRLPP
jgi:hypothetical protein